MLEGITWRKSREKSPEKISKGILRFNPRRNLSMNSWMKSLEKLLLKILWIIPGENFRRSFWWKSAEGTLEKILRNFGRESPEEFLVQISTEIPEGKRRIIPKGISGGNPQNIPGQNPRRNSWRESQKIFWGEIPGEILRKDLRKNTWRKHLIFFRYNPRRNLLMNSWTKSSEKLLLKIP